MYPLSRSRRAFSAIFRTSRVLWLQSHKKKYTSEKILSKTKILCSCGKSRRFGSILKGFLHSGYLVCDKKSIFILDLTLLRYNLTMIKVWSETQKLRCPVLSLFLYSGRDCQFFITIRRQVLSWGMEKLRCLIHIIGEFTKFLHLSDWTCLLTYHNQKSSPAVLR